MSKTMFALAGSALVLGYSAVQLNVPSHAQSQATSFADSEATSEASSQAASEASTESALEWGFPMQVYQPWPPFNWDRTPQYMTPPMMAPIPVPVPMPTPTITPRSRYGLARVIPRSSTSRTSPVVREYRWSNHRRRH